jgi:hypothetical protein
MMFANKVAMTTLALTAGAMSLGINCLGSDRCSVGIASLGDLIFTVEAQGINPNRLYNNNENIVCIAADGDVNNPGLCAFIQRAFGPIAGKDVLSLLQEISDHGCTQCGSVPLLFPNDNNINDHGELTVNVVDVANCNGIC